ncbi:MAG: hypothetical protein EAZ57_00140 [Cytophagales bacterium]|nr:MAG: hypothetical protein EAZ67_13060 [Cytophagales bacterium]TAF62511.1 MAG: hypothetical protein EAZ57_00140 [Cytophagales bacterium]
MPPDQHKEHNTTTPHYAGADYSQPLGKQKFYYSSPISYHSSSQTVTQEPKKFVYASQSNSHVYSYSDNLKWLKAPENIISKADFGEQSLLLTNKRLYLRDKVKNSSFLLEELSEIALKFRRLMLPLVVGGIAGPLFLVAVLKGLLVWWIGLCVSFAGFLLLAWGWQGSHQLEIKKGQQHLAITLKSAPKYWQAIINLAEKQRALRVYKPS